MEAKKPINLGMIALGKVNTLEKRVKKLEDYVKKLEDEKTRQEDRTSLETLGTNKTA